MKEKDNVENNDFYTSAYLVAKGHKCIDVNNIRNGWNVFIFERTAELEKDLAEYFANRGTVNPSEFVKEIKRLKTVIHSQEQNQKTKEWNNNAI
jgi:hypothetical protein